MISAGAVLVVVFAAAEGDSVDRVAVAMNRSGADVEIRLPAPRSGHGLARPYRHA